ncbi:outer membrane immunogenic protein [Roseiarcus fermentans]|uniref:Outer membrane immunogenic protein n=1 Tax=Roseiarcus fermentans TaxID=1473586 RepID=A0A366F1L8_9HYPH|nr:outer membrane beta-barrel protein [Roseiarcus fermentans]RBP08558.1 outer membrane immunogenic protein [Roseiarcus fermentans]
MSGRSVVGALGVTLTLLVGAAQAADLPTKKPAPAPIDIPPPFSFTGPYLGLQGGYGYDGEVIYLPAMWHNSWSADRHGGFGGVVGGYDYQFSSNIVLGLQADYNLADITGGSAPHGLYTTTNKVDSFGSVDLKLGYAFNHWLVYAIGGLGLMDVTHTIDQPLYPYAYGRYDQFSSGYDFGLGVEYAFTNNWIGFADFRKYNMPSKWYPAIPVLGSHSVTESLDIVRFGIAYRFGT